MQSNYFEHTKIVDIEAGHSYVLGLNNLNEIFSFGTGQNGTLGQGNTTILLKPNKIKFDYENIEIISIGAGGNHGGAITKSRKTLMWGFGGDGRLGMGNDSSIFSPKFVDDLESENIVRIHGG